MWIHGSSLLHSAFSSPAAAVAGMKGAHDAQPCAHSLQILGQRLSRKREERREDGVRETEREEDLCRRERQAGIRNDTA